LDEQVSLLLLDLEACCEITAAKNFGRRFPARTALRPRSEKLVDLGPRPAGSDAFVRARAYIEEQLETFGWKVTEQQFTDNTPRGPVTFVNLIARFGGSTKPAFLLCSHYDTKIFDSFRFVGAK